MPDRTFRPKEQALLLAQREQLYAAVIVVGLWKDGIVVDENTPIATVLANECDFDGYARAEDVILDTLASLGASAFLNLAHIMAQFVYGPVADPQITNNVGGMFVLVQTAVGPPAVYDVFSYTTFDAPVPMGNVGDVIEKVVSEVIPN